MANVALLVLAGDSLSCFDVQSADGSSDGCPRWVAARVHPVVTAAMSCGDDIAPAAGVLSSIHLRHRDGTAAPTFMGTAVRMLYDEDGAEQQVRFTYEPPAFTAKAAATTANACITRPGHALSLTDGCVVSDPIATPTMWIRIDARSCDPTSSTHCLTLSTKACPALSASGRVECASISTDLLGEVAQRVRVSVDGCVRVTDDASDDVAWEAEMPSEVLAAWIVAFDHAEGASTVRGLRNIYVEPPKSSDDADGTTGGTSIFVNVESRRLAVFGPCDAIGHASAQAVAAAFAEVTVTVTDGDQLNSSSSDACESNSSGSDEADTWWLLRGRPTSTGAFLARASSTWIRDAVRGSAATSATASYQAPSATSFTSSTSSTSVIDLASDSRRAAGSIATTAAAAGVGVGAGVSVGFTPTSQLGARQWDGVLQQQHHGASASPPAAASPSPSPPGARSTSSVPVPTPLRTSSSSHFLEHFDPTGYLGRGADGQVIKVRHRLTLAQYAMKIVPVQSEEHSQSVLRETQILAQLSHSNLVRFYHCWIEDVPAVAIRRLEAFARAFDPNASDSASFEWADADTDDSDAGSSSAGWSSHAFDTPTASRRDVHSSSRGRDHQPTEATTTTVSVRRPYAPDDEDAGPGGPGCGPLVQYQPPPAAQGSPNSVNFIGDAATNATLPVRVVFIQMEVYPMSLHDYIQRRDPKRFVFTQLVKALDQAVVGLDTVESPSSVSQALGRALPSDTMDEVILERQRLLSFMLDVLSGLAFIHSRGVVHRDVKPANVFVDPSCSHAWVGDWGLSKVADETLRGNADREEDEDDAAATDGLPNRTVRALAAASAPFPRRHADEADPNTPNSLQEVTYPAMQSSAVVTPTGNSAFELGGPVLPMHTQGVGSPLYAAPEQLRGRRCDPLCDAFAAGIVFLESYYAFATAAERHAVLMAANRGLVDPDMIRCFPELRIAAALVAPTRRARLSIPQALKLVRSAFNKMSEEVERRGL